MPSIAPKPPIGEGRRLRAFELKQEGFSQQNIARALGVCKKSAVSQWIKRAPGKAAARKP